MSKSFDVLGRKPCVWGRCNGMQDSTGRCNRCGTRDPRAVAPTPAAACPRCGGWTSSGGMSQYRNSTVPVHGRTGCTCTGLKIETPQSVV